MSFLAFENNIENRTVSLQAEIYDKLKSKGTSPFTSPAYRKASITIEAALVIPVFLFFVLNLISIIGIFSFYSGVQAAVLETGKKLADYAYIKDTAAEKLPFDMEIFPEKLTSILTVKSLVEKQFAQDDAGKEKLQYLYTQLLQDEEDLVDIVVHYSVGPMFRTPGFGRFLLINRCRIKGFNGYHNSGGVVSGDEEEIVYITEAGSVYHRDRSCSHLKLSIKTVLPSMVEDARNEGGGKYKRCELCRSEGENGIYYITGQGDRYHTTINCSGLKRTVIEIFLSQTGDRAPCSRCGY